MKKSLLLVPVVFLLMMSCAEELTYDAMTDASHVVIAPGESHTYEMVSEVKKVARIGSATISLDSSKTSSDYGRTRYSFTITNPSGLEYSVPGLSFTESSTYNSGNEIPAYMLVGQPINGTWKFEIANDADSYDIEYSVVEIVLEF